MKTLPNVSVRGLVISVFILCSFFLLPNDADATTTQIVGGTISTDTTWNTGTIYIVQSNITVSSGVTLTVQPGTYIKFNANLSNTFRITVDGTLNAVGTATSSIFFTSIHDDEGHDTNGTSTLPDEGDWCQIRVNSGGVATLSHAIIRYGGNENGSPCLGQQVYNNGGVITISNATSTNSLTYNIYNSTGTTTISNSNIGNSTNGIYSVGGVLSVATSTIHTNTGRGLFVRGSGSINFNGNTFTNHSSYVGELDLSDGLIFTNADNKFSGTGKRGILVSTTFSGGPLDDHYIFRTDLPYIFYNEITVDSGKTLTIDRSIVKFENQQSRITVNGTFNAFGSIATSTVLTSIKDDLMGGDSNGDATSTSASAGDWCHIKINSGGSAVFEHAIVRYGGYDNTNPCASNMVFNNGGEVDFLASSTVSYSAGVGVRTSSGTTTIDGTDISYNSFGVRHAGGVSDIDGDNTFANNSSYGIYNDTGVSIDAENNFWNTSSGPYHASLNPTGSGDNVSNNVDFAPYITSIHYVLPSNYFAVDNNELRITASTTYSSELNAATSTWDALGNINIFKDNLNPNLNILDGSNSDVAWKGQYDKDQSPKLITLNRYYLDGQDSTLRQNTITHELGHAVGLNHSYLGNIMVLYQTNQTVLGPQDIIDYEHLW